MCRYVMLWCCVVLLYVILFCFVLGCNSCGSEERRVVKECRCGLLPSCFRYRRLLGEVAVDVHY